MYSTFQVNIGSGCTQLNSSIVKTEDGINIYIGGGEKAHIGTVVMSQPRPSLTGDGSMSCTTSVFNRLGHKDDEMAKPLAEAICKYFNETTVVTAGVHVDEATPQDIEKLKSNGVQMISLIIEVMKE